MTRRDNKLRRLTGYRLQRANSAFAARVNKILARFGLRRTTFAALEIVNDMPGLRQSQLAEALAIERPNIVRLIDELERESLLERRAAASDRRAYALRITSRGRELLNRAREAVETLDNLLTSDLTPSEKQLVHRAIEAIERAAREKEVGHNAQVSRP